MNELLARTFYGNTILQWLTAFALIVAAVVAGKVAYWIFKNVFRRLTAKTKTKLDNIVIDMIEEPIVVIVTIFGFWVALKNLTLPDKFYDVLGHVTEGAIIVAVTWMIARLMDSIIREYLVPLAQKTESDLDDQILPILHKGVKLSIWALGVIVALNNAGLNVTGLLAGLGIGGLALAMAAKDTVSNVFGGFTIFTDRPFGLNDRVRVGGYDGNIREIGLRSTRLVTLAGTEVTIPNSAFADSAVENVTREPHRKVVLELGLTYDTTPEQMEKAMGYLRELAESNEALEEKLAIGFSAFGDSAMILKMIYYIKPGSDILGTESAVNMAILAKFNAEGLDFAFPTRTIYTHSAG